MIDKANIDKTNSWPFVEAKKILKERNKSIKSTEKSENNRSKTHVYHRKLR